VKNAKWEATQISTPTVKPTPETEKSRTEGLDLLDTGSEELLVKICAHFRQYDSHFEKKL